MGSYQYVQPRFSRSSCVAKYLADQSAHTIGLSQVELVFTSTVDTSSSRRMSMNRLCRVACLLDSGRLPSNGVSSSAERLVDIPVK